MKPTTKQKIDPEQVKQALLQFCVQDESDYRVAMQGIFNTEKFNDSNGSGVLVACDGHVLAEVDLAEYTDLKGIGEDRLVVDGSDYPKWSTVIPGHDREGYPYEAGLDIHPSELKTPPEKIPEPEDETPDKCEFCDGEGVVDHSCDCEYCDIDEYKCDNCNGQGEIKRPAGSLSLVRINTHWYQARYMNKLVDLMDSMGIENARLWQGPADGYRTALIEAPGLRLLCMPVVKSNESDYQLDTIHKIDLQ